MPLGCLSDASKMPSWRNLQAAEQPVYGRRSLSCRRQHVGLQGLKKKRICHTQPRKPSGIGTRSDREISKNYLQIRRTQFVLASLQPYILTTLHSYNLTFLQHYIITFSFSTSPFRPFGLSQSSKQHPQKNEARSDAEEDYRSLSAPRKWLEKFFQRAKSDLCGKQKASMLSLFG